MKKRTVCIFVFILILGLISIACAACFPGEALPVPSSEAETEEVITTRPAEEPSSDDSEAEAVRLTAANYPRVDGSTATKPLAKAFYEAFTGEKIDDVDHSKTHNAYMNLIDGKADLILVVDPSEDEIRVAEEKNVKLRYDTVVNEAFVFFVNSGNPVQSLTLDEIRDIYSGKITNWKDLGGDDAEILAYQRPVNSGSQTGMLDLVMKDVPVMDAPMERISTGMGDIIDAISDYDNGKYAIGYSYYYYANTMYVGENCRLLAVNGAAPSDETIIAGSYPILTRYIAVTREEDASPETKALLAAMLSDEGQRIAKQAGYVPIRNLAEDEEPKRSGDEKTLDLNAFYDENALAFTVIEEEFEGYTIRIPVVDGFQDEAHEAAVNVYLKEYAEETVRMCLDSASDEKITAVDLLFLPQASFSDCLCGLFSAYCYGENMNNNGYSNRKLALDLREIRELSVYDFFKEDAKSADVMKQSVTRWFVKYIDSSMAYTGQDLDDLKFDLCRRFDEREPFEFYFTANGMWLVLYNKDGSQMQPFIRFDECADQVVIYDRYQDGESLYDGQYECGKNIPVCVQTVTGQSNILLEKHEKAEDHYLESLMMILGEMNDTVKEKLRSFFEEKIPEKMGEAGSPYFIQNTCCEVYQDGDQYTMTLIHGMITEETEDDFEADYETFLNRLRSANEVYLEGPHFYLWDLQYQTAAYPLRGQLWFDDYEIFIFDRHGDLIGP